MREGWESNTLGEVSKLITRGISPKYLESGGLCVLNQKCIRGHKVNYELARRHDSEAKPVKQERLIELGDVLINSTGTGTLGRVAQVRELVEEPVTVDSHVTIVRPMPGKFYLDYFGYLLINIENKLKEAGEGASGQTELAKSVIANDFVVKYPTSHEVQKRIVNLLDSFFEEMEKGIYSIQKMLEGSKSLFDSYLNEIFNAEGSDYKAYTLGQVCKFIGGSQPPKSVFEFEKNEDNVRLIQIRDYKSDKNIVYVPTRLARRFCNSDDVMIGRYGPPVFQILRGLEGAYNVALMKALPDEKVITKDYLFYFLKNQKIQNHIISLSSRAAGQSGLNKETIEPYPISLPSIEKQIEITKNIVKLSNEIAKLEVIQNKRLELYRALEKSIFNEAFNGSLVEK